MVQLRRKSQKKMQGGLLLGEKKKQVVTFVNSRSQQFLEYENEREVNVVVVYPLK